MERINTLRYYLKRFSSYRIPTYAASASFFAITAIFPLLMLILSVLSFTPFGTETFLNAVSRMLPQAFRRMFAFIAEDVMHADAFALSFSVVFTLWTASRCMLGILDGLNSIADVNDNRNFIFKRIACMLYVLALIIVLILTLALRVFGNAILALFQQYLPPLGRIFSVIMDFRGLTLFGFTAMIITLLYTFFPHKKMPFLQQIPGGVFASAAWLGFSELYSLYVDHVLTTTTVYGSLGIFIFAMLWVYFCMWIIFLGAVINQLYPSIIKRKQK